MNIDPIIPSILHVTAKSDVNIENDLNCPENKTIAQLLQIEDNSEEKKEDQQND
jgi:hypothetical protein